MTASTVIGATVGFVGLAAGISKLTGIEIPKPVTCWFCAHKQSVKFSQRNSWDCKSCGQYNGFSSDGDYNKSIKGQHSEAPIPMKSSFTQHGQYQPSGNNLCDTCNRNQEMKIYQLRQFTPSNIKNEDKELQDYTAHLERTYRLCRTCEAKVRQVIGEQDSKLKQKFLAWKLSLFRKSPLVSSQDSASEIYLSVISRIVMISLAAIIWIASLQETPLKNVPEEMLKFVTKFISVPQNFGYFELVTIAVPLALAVGYCQSPTTSLSKSWRHVLSIGAWLALFLQRVLEMTMFKCEIATLSLIFCLISSLSFKKELSKQGKIEQKRTARKKLYQDLNEKIEEEEVEMSSNSVTPTPSLPKNDDFYLPNHEIYQNSEEQCDLSTLKINAKMGKNEEEQRPKSPFSIKNYSPNSCNESTINFGDLTTRSGTFLKPAKFVYNERNRVAQSSWVAGGYWLNSKPNEIGKQTLSRSSSQSSGIGSLTSAAALNQQLFVSSLPNSRVNSTCGEFQERFSIFSEPAFLNSTLKNRSRFENQDNDNESLNSSFGRLSQEAFSKLQPRAKSSPKTSDDHESINSSSKDVSFLERKITINISMYSLFLFLSVGFNITLSIYLFTTYVWH